MAKLSGVYTAIVVSQTAWPVLKLVASFPDLTKPSILVPLGFFVLSSAGFLLKWFLSSKSPSKPSTNPNIVGRGTLFYACCLFSFSAVIDLIFYFEVVGVVEGYMDFYLETGERYFVTPYGALSLLWDFIVHYPLYLAIIYAIDNRKDCRNLVVYWGSTMVLSLITLIFGAMAGSYGKEMQPASWLNTPYAILPTYYFLTFMMQPRHLPDHKVYRKESYNIQDVILAVCLIAGCIFSFIRALGALNSPFPYAQMYASKYEPYIVHPTSFGQVWILCAFFMGTFVQVVLARGLFVQNALWMLDWSLVNTAFTVYGTFFHVIAQFFPRLEPEYRIPDENLWFVVAANLFYPVVAIATTVRSFSVVTHDKKGT